MGSVAMDMLKDLMKRKNARRGAALERASSYPVGPMLTVPRPVLVKMEEEESSGVGPEGLVDLDGDIDMEAGFAPLVRVGSRRDLRDGEIELV
jgi:hypothetical protein